ncbi:SDR family NAD(P)-dependent oxidoreductase [Streptomyces violaceusniger]|uniref:SDR family NAD(P)-dependent oxidoreductase n=1 Tax=Streptomyces violaceusniger TaxID=68280 RepID=UPI000997A0D5|nr:SDR family NAD(P)-dependent oxidoreductase [Streptomyces hygroscopicus]AQW48333.1 hypothetical protein SHXM_01796 [Streptomyces hygroscopicus]
MRTLEGTRAVVTGAGRGLGRATALRLAAAGSVAVVDRDLDSSAEFREEANLLTARSVMWEVKAHGVDATGLRCDVSVRAEVREAMRTAAAIWDGNDVLVCNAGGGTGAIHDNKASELDAEKLSTRCCGSTGMARCTAVSRPPY